MPSFEPLRIFVGYDEKEAAAYHVCCQSIIETASRPVQITPLCLNHIASIYREKHGDGSNAFIYSRFLVPYLCGFAGYAIYLDGDMIVRRDLAELWSLANFMYAAQVVKHDYKTKYPVKYLSQKNTDYPMKNQSSVILWNCTSHYNRKLTPELVASTPGSLLHTFDWIPDERIGALPSEWNHLCMEAPERPSAAIYHYTIGLPAFKGYETQEGATEWLDTYRRAITPLGTSDGLDL